MDDSPPVPPRPDRGFGEPDTHTLEPTETHPRGRTFTASRLRERTAATWSVWTAIAVLLVGDFFVGQLVVGTLVALALGLHTIPSGPAGIPQITLAIAADLGWFATMAIWMRWQVPQWRAILGVPPRDRTLREMAVGALCGVGIYVGVAIVIAIAVTEFVGLFSSQQVVGPKQIQSGLPVRGVVLTVVLSVIVAPVTEETFFRGILFRSLRDRHGFWVGALVSAALFGVFHFIPGEAWQSNTVLMVCMMFTGFALASLYEWRGNLLSNIGAHMAFNTIGVFLIFAVK